MDVYGLKAQIPRTGWIARRPNHETIKRNRRSNISRIGGMGAKSGRRLGLDGAEKERTDWADI